MYSGWTNYETWAVNVWYDGFDGLEVEDGLEPGDGFVSGIADRMEEIVREDVGTPGRLAGDLLEAALGAVNWHELAEAYAADLNLPESGEGW